MNGILFMHPHSMKPETIDTILKLTGLSSEILDRIIARYLEPERHYHGLEHIQRMFTMAAAKNVVPTRAQALAILYHDAVYIPGSTHGQNEMLSALLLRQHGNGGLVPAHIIDEAVTIIHDTINHTASIDSSRLVLDLDLSGLGAPWEQFHADSEAVFREVQHLVRNAQDYYERRAAFFETLCKRTQIYLLPDFSSLEPIARQNMQRTIDDVRGARDMANG